MNQSAAASQQDQEHNPKPHLIRGVDSLRFLAALWVAFSHGALFPLKELIGQHQGSLGFLISGIYKMAFNGTAAVVVFFLISGFCIHYPNANAGELNWKSFLVKRIIRIGTPLLAVLAIIYALGDEYIRQESKVLWSIYCEIIYYLLYPVLFLAFSRFGEHKVLACSLLITFLMLIIAPNNNYLWQYSVFFTWLYCAPFWLAGCLLAKTINEQKIPLLLQVPISVWRLLAIVLGVASTILANHLPIQIGYVWTMPFFAAFCFFWLYSEFRVAEKLKPIALLELLGKAGYSIYLVHKITITAIDNYFYDANIILHWVFQIFAIAIGSGVFYFLIERSSHLMAQKIGKNIARSRRHTNASESKTLNLDIPI